MEDVRTGKWFMSVDKVTYFKARKFNSVGNMTLYTLFGKQEYNACGDTIKSLHGTNIDEFKEYKFNLIFKIWLI